jgi:hypothetical protein
MLHVLLLVLGGRVWLLLLVSTRVGTWLGSVPGASTMADISGTDAGVQPLGAAQWQTSPQVLGLMLGQHRWWSRGGEGG